MISKELVAKIRNLAPLQKADRQAVQQDDEFRRQCRRNSARLLKKILEVDPLLCTKCQEAMKIVSFIEDPAAIQRILRHLDLWEAPKRSPPSASRPHDFVCHPDFLTGLPD